eukprot:293276_1
MRIHTTLLGFNNFAFFGMFVIIGIIFLSNFTNASDSLRPKENHTWQCPGTCTKRHDPAALYCDMCNEERPDDAWWRCSNCGCDRGGYMDHCNICNLRKTSHKGSASTEKNDNFWIGGGFLFVLIISAIILAVKKQNILQQVKKDDPEELPLFQENEVKPKEKGSRRRCKHGDRYFWERCHSITLGAIMVCTCTCTGVVEYRNWRRRRRQRPHRAPICSFELVNRLFSDSSY